MRRPLATAAAGLVVTLAFTGAPSAAAPPTGSSMAAASASASAAPTLPVIHGSDIPLVASPAPSAAEWTAAKPVLPTRGAPLGCELLLLREWLRVRCPEWQGTERLGAGLIAGDTKGVRASVRVLVQGRGDNERDHIEATVVVPVQRGQARIVGFNDAIGEYDGTALGEGPTLGIVWREGRADPVLAMYGPPQMH